MDNRYRLIDYGRAIGINELSDEFPPNDFTIDNDIIPSVKEDKNELHYWLTIATNNY